MGLDEEEWHKVDLMQTFKNVGDGTAVRALFGFALFRVSTLLACLV